jgi:hypothetical protein
VKSKPKKEQIHAILVLDVDTRWSDGDVLVENSPLEKIWLEKGSPLPMLSSIIKVRKTDKPVKGVDSHHMVRYYEIVQ